MSRLKTPTDELFMRRALLLAAKGGARVAPNPKVGCVIVRNGKIVAEGFHQKFGGDHAEIVALKKLKGRAKNATLYVTLEPCHHFGKTPPCVDAVIASGISRVVIATKDPNPLTSGKSIRKLKKTGIAVDVGVCEREAHELNCGFNKWIKVREPYVTVKIAQSLDGKISTRRGQQGWITGDEARKYVHNLRSQVDAILVGRGTIEIDDPQLNVRLSKGMSKHHPKRVILDSHLEISEKARIFNSSGGEVLLFCVLPSEHPRVQHFSRLGVRVFCAPQAERVPIDWMLSQLGALGVTSLLVEGGSGIFTEFLLSDRADEWQFIIAPKWIGGVGQPVFDIQRLGVLSADFCDSDISSTPLGRDLLMRCVKR